MSAEIVGPLSFSRCNRKRSSVEALGPVRDNPTMVFLLRMGRFYSRQDLMPSCGSAGPVAGMPHRESIVFVTTNLAHTTRRSLRWLQGPWCNWQHINPSCYKVRVRIPPGPPLSLVLVGGSGEEVPDGGPPQVILTSVMRLPIINL